MDYREAVDYIFGHTNYEVVPRLPHIQANYDLRRVYQLLEKLGNPHLRAQSLHITGTNGKGSTSAMLASILMAAGYKTGLYTSPHLITMRERFTVDGVPITESEIADIISRLQPEIEKLNQEATYGCLTVFEILTVLCFVYFAEKGCQFQVMEVGMGGRFDATNVIQPEVCLLTSISYDHTEVLGDTLTKIATEKCGIIKSGAAVVSHPQEAEAERVIRETCDARGVKLIRIGRDITCTSLSHGQDGQELEVQGRLDRYRLSLPLIGEYQLVNTAAAVAAAEVLIERSYHISREAIIKGLAEVIFPGRMQLVGRHPWIVLDGGHNPGAARRLKESLALYFKPARSILVFGVSGDKDIPGVVRELAPIFDEIIVTRAHNPRSASPEALAAEFAQYGLKVSVTQNISQAVEQARAMAGKEDLICITGSLFVVGEALQHTIRPPGNP